MANVPGGYTRERLSDPVRQQVIIERSDADDLAALARVQKTTKGALIRTAIRRFLGRIERRPLVLFIAMLAGCDAGEDLAPALAATESEIERYYLQAAFSDCEPMSRVLIPPDFAPADSLRMIVVARATVRLGDGLFMAFIDKDTRASVEESARSLNEFSTRADSIQILRVARQLVREMERAKCDDSP